MSSANKLRSCEQPLCRSFKRLMFDILSSLCCNSLPLSVFTPTALFFPLFIVVCEALEATCVCESLSVARRSTFFYKNVVDKRYVVIVSCSTEPCIVNDTYKWPVLQYSNIPSFFRPMITCPLFNLCEWVKKWTPLMMIFFFLPFSYYFPFGCIYIALLLGF